MSLKDFVKRNFLYPTVFITGACVLIVEIVAVRILSPYFGNTIFNVSSVITVILCALSIGYYFGGTLADKNPSTNIFFRIISISGLLLIILHFLGSVSLLPLFGFILPLSYGPLISSLVLFFIPAFLLGMLSPYAIKLQSLVNSEQGIGKIAGKMFFWSTLGSIFGSLSAGFILIPNVGINNIMIGTATLLFIFGSIPSFFLNSKKFNLLKIIFIVVIFSGLYSSTNSVKGQCLLNKDGVYERLAVCDAEYLNRPTRFFLQDKSNSGAMFLDSNDPKDLVFDYTKYYSVFKTRFNDLQKALVIGGGAYSVPRALASESKQAIVDVVEIEPSLFQMAKDYFNLNQQVEKINNYIKDGRQFLKSAEDNTYDLIFSDVYYSLYSIPPHFTTKEFFNLAKSKMSERGFFVGNFIGGLSRKSDSFILSEIKTFKEVFPNSYFFATRNSATLDIQNLIFVGYKGDDYIDFSDESVLTKLGLDANLFLSKQIDTSRFDFSKTQVLTDDFAPVDFLVLDILKKNKNDGISGEEMIALIDQQINLGPRYLGSEGNKKTVDLIKKEMTIFTDSVSEQSFNYKSIDSNEYELSNVVARLFPEKERRVILGTHFDSKKYADSEKKNKNQNVPGANDSASGTAVLIELARFLKEHEKEVNVGIDFAFFNGEEGDPNIIDDYQNWSPLGSTHFASNLKDFYSNKNPEMAIIVDMVCDKNLKIYKEKNSLINAPKQTDDFWRIATALAPRNFINDSKYDIKDGHTPLNQASIPSILLIDFDYPYFHTINDTTDKCNAKSLSSVANAIKEYIISL